MRMLELFATASSDHRHAFEMLLLKMYSKSMTPKADSKGSRLSLQMLAVSPDLNELMVWQVFHVSSSTRPFSRCLSSEEKTLR